MISNVENAKQWLIEVFNSSTPKEVSVVMKSSAPAEYIRRERLARGCNIILWKMEDYALHYKKSVAQVMLNKDIDEATREKYANAKAEYLGANLTRYLKEKNIKAKKACRQLGKGKDYLYPIEKGEKSVYLQSLQEIADLLEIEVVDLLLPPSVGNDND